jgi:hypothetical protein
LEVYMGAWESLGSWQRIGAGLLTAGLVSAGASGCLVIVDDTNTSISGSWTIDGGAASASSCAAIGIDTVELTLYLPGSAVPYETLSASCAAGSVDSRTTGAFISSGSYEYTFEAFRGASSVALTGRTPVRLAINDHTRVSTNFASATGFDPRGSDATAEASWTIDGATPSAASCAALGVARVRVAFQNGATWYEHPDLTAPCSAGRIDTRTSPGPVIAAGDWVMQVQALDAAGAIVAQGMSADLTVPQQPPVSHVVMDPIDFTGGAFNPMGSDATVAGSWQLNGRMPTSDSCYALGIDRVRVALYAASDVAFENGVTIYQAQCSAGFFDSRPMPVIRAGRYLWAVEAVDAAGEIVAEYSEMTPLDIPAGTHVDLPLVDFAFPTTLTLGLEWQAPTGGAFTTCAAAGVATYNYTLFRDGSIVATADARPCQDLVSFNATDTAGFGPGTYALYFEGFNGAGRKQWAVPPSTCDGIRVDNNGLVARTCGASFTP